MICAEQGSPSRKRSLKSTATGAGRRDPVTGWNPGRRHAREADGE